MIVIKKNKKAYNEYKVTMTVTAGKVLAIYHALNNNKTAVGVDVIYELVSADNKQPEADRIIQDRIFQ